MHEACVFYVKGSRPLPRKVLQCGRSPARAQAALPLAAPSPLTLTTRRRRLRDMFLENNSQRSSVGRPYA